MWDQMFQSVDLLQQGLQAGWARSAVIRNNIANYETPNFKSSDVEFERIFAASLETDELYLQNKMTRDKHRDFHVPDEVETGYVITQNEAENMRLDGNSVDLEAESNKLAQNTIWYNTVMSKLNSEMGRIRMAIREGR